MQILMSFYEEQLKQLISYMLLNPVQFFYFPILMIQMLFPQIQQAPGLNLRKVGKSLDVGVNCIHNFYLGRFIIRYTVRNLVLR